MSNLSGLRSLPSASRIAVYLNFFCYISLEVVVFFVVKEAGHLFPIFLVFGQHL